MANRKLLVGMECRTLLLFAAQKQLPLTLTTKNEKNWHLLKANFLACQSKRLILSMPIPENGRPPIEPAPTQQCAVTFKKGYYKFIFTTRTIAQTQHHIDSDLSVPALVVLCPSHIEKIQRRAYNRAIAPQDPPVTITFQKSPNKSSSTQLSPWQATLSDLSAGGLSVTCHPATASRLNENDQFLCRFVPIPNQDELAFHVRVRHITHSQTPDRTTVGCQIIGIEMDENGRNTLQRLTRVVAIYHRQKLLAPANSK